PRSESADSHRENNAGEWTKLWQARPRDGRGHRVSRERDSARQDRYEFDLIASQDPSVISSGCWQSNRFPRRQRAREGRWNPKPQARDGKGGRCPPSGRAKKRDSCGSIRETGRGAERKVLEGAPPAAGAPSD